MPTSIPEGLTRQHVVGALSDLDAGVPHPFGEPTGYELVYDGRRYRPKAVIGLAFRHMTREILAPEDFSGGEAPAQADFVLRQLGFTVERKTSWTNKDADDSVATDTRPLPKGSGSSNR